MYSYCKNLLCYVAPDLFANSIEDSKIMPISEPTLTTPLNSTNRIHQVSFNHSNLNLNAVQFKDILKFTK